MARFWLPTAARLGFEIERRIERPMPSEHFRGLNGEGTIIAPDAVRDSLYGPSKPKMRPDIERPLRVLAV